MNQIPHYPYLPLYPDLAPILSNRTTISYEWQVILLYMNLFLKGMIRTSPSQNQFVAAQTSK